ncbi:MAG TPA: HAMP domain-containing histidine kinase [Clostridiales bacterium]|nr:HAMP domain-containing histidine kinase [Clostridiales bacterium]
MNSIYFKNFIVTAGMVLLSFLILGTAFVFLGRSFVVNEKRDSMYTNAEEVAKFASAYRQEGELSNWNLRMWISTISRCTGNHIFISDEKGLVVSCSDMELVCPHIGQQMSAQVMLALGPAGKLNQLTNLDGFYDSAYYVVAVPISTSEGLVAGYVFVGSDSSTIVEAWGTFMIVFLAVAMVIMLMAVCFSFVTSKRQAKPINEMAFAAHRFARGDFSIRVEDEGREDEIGELTRSFNAMADSLEKAEELRRNFIANVSHELKTPMTTISGFANGILDGTIPPENQRKYLAIISSETKRLSRLVRSMLELSRIQSEYNDELKKTPFDLNEVLLRTFLVFEEKITSKNLEVDVQIPEESVIVLGNSDGITQVIYNIMDNAVKFAHPNTTLGLSLWKQDGKAYVSVKNTGDTIPPGELPFLFDRFHKTDRSRSLDRDGVGLGLYIVKTILNNHDEDIFVTSKDGVTEFIFTSTLKT